MHPLRTAVFCLALLLSGSFSMKSEASERLTRTSDALTRPSDGTPSDAGRDKKKKKKGGEEDEEDLAPAVPSLAA